MNFYAWYVNGTYSPETGLGWTAIGWVKAKSATEAAHKAKADGCKWTTVRITNGPGCDPEQEFLAEC